MNQSIKSIPLISKAAGAAKRMTARTTFKGSSAYWEDRYSKAGNSGAGSYGEVAQFKADVLNRLVAEHGVDRVLELGCGDGGQLALAEYPMYIGLDVAPTAVRLCAEKFTGDLTKSFYLYDSEAFVDNARLFDSDMTISLEVIFHLIEHDVFDRYMRDLFDKSSRLVVIFSSNVDGATGVPHYRDRQFTTWVDAHLPEFELLEQVPGPAAATSDFFVYKRRGR